MSEIIFEKNMQFYDLKAQYNEMQTSIDTRLAKVFSHGRFILGPEVLELEQQLANYAGVKYCTTCGNGTDAILIALLALGIGKGDEVILPAFNYIAGVEMVTHLGATPVYADVDEITFNINIDEVPALISPNTKAIIATSLFGQSYDYVGLKQIAADRDIAVIEDAAQSFGASRDSIKSCSFADISCTSFFPTKPLGCFGDGGAIFTNNPKLHTEMQKLGRHGQSEKYKHDSIGMNSRLDTVQAAILLTKLEHLDRYIFLKDEVSKCYSEGLQHITNLKTPKTAKNSRSAWAQYTIRVEDRSSLQAYLKKYDIPTMVHYPIPTYKQSAYYVKNLELLNTERLCESVLSLPMHPHLTHNEIEHIIETISSYYR